MIKNFFDKRIFKEFDFIFILYILLGYIMLFTTVFDNLYSIKNVGILFLILSIVYYITSIFTKNKLSLKLFFQFIINALISLCLFVFQNSDHNIILAICIVVHSIFNISVNIIYLNKLRDKIYLLLNFIYNLMLLILGIIVSINFYYKTTIDIITLGYYFISFGFVSIFDLIIYQYNYILSFYSKKSKKRNSLKEVRKTKLIK